MREGAERERWERLSFQLLTLSKFVGSKDTKQEDFDKFSMIDKPQKAKKVETKSAMRTLKHIFPQK
jgi:hypothetical protein